MTNQAGLAMSVVSGSSRACLAVVALLALGAGCSGTVSWEEQESGLREYFRTHRVEKPDYAVFQDGKAVIAVFGFYDLDSQRHDDGDEGVCLRIAKSLNEEAGEARFLCGPLN